MLRELLKLQFLHYALEAMPLNARWHELRRWWRAKLRRTISRKSVAALHVVLALIKLEKGAVFGEHCEVG